MKSLFGIKVWSGAIKSEAKFSSSVAKRAPFATELENLVRTLGRCVELPENMGPNLFFRSRLRYKNSVSVPFSEGCFCARPGAVAKRRLYRGSGFEALRRNVVRFRGHVPIAVINAPSVSGAQCDVGGEEGAAKRTP